ncbi:hypothetical protein LUZ60_008485 [Juncus effusus]|nr:hypothetical protein LUZ60_008485 [Juncus effusus]
MLVQHRDAATFAGDLSAITGIMGQYDVIRNWVGDPCFPQSYSWYGVGCNYEVSSTAISATATIVSLNLSSSGLKGPISGNFSTFASIENLNLSDNNLTGSAPDFLAYMSSLKVLIPDALRQNANAGKLTLRFEPQKEGCEVKDNPKKKRILIIIISVASAAVVAMLIGLLICIRKLRLKASHTNATRGVVEWGDIGTANRFPKSQLEDIIKTYNKHLGGGGFGEVYYGKLEEETEIAIKVLSNASTQGYKEFRKEVEALSSVYHGNIVSFIGYCEEGEYLALVYEFMPNGSLADHLKTAESSIPSILNWRGKLKIVHGAAQGLEYLHTGLSMVHMDVKSGNILLDKNFEAKVADFGMSRIFDGSTVTMTQSSICGTIGYLDPEILTGLSKKLSFPSDVYSFGVVLLEIVTGQSPYSPDRGSLHIVDYVSRNPYNPNIIDPKLGDYDPECMRMVITLAMKCTQRTSQDRPTMSEVVIELQQCLDVGMSLQWSTSQGISSTTSKTILSLSNTDQTDSFSTF